MDALRDIAELLTAPPKVDDPLADIAALLTGGEATRVREVSFAVPLHKPAHLPQLPLGATARNPEGYDEATYLALQRRPQRMRLRDVAGRNSHRRWDTPVTTLGEHLEAAHRRWGDAEARRQYARAQAARLWYGTPNIILGT